eukprot:CAMPEP_0201726926 /NCGR_PEP_ID=MMETSP0593-20130828/10527_1 /ASSEMBLY_ACC=CAM_ASM_000672 /TAXON_ID=267983 /ORGANISM="Skeletonema japonicum, Strain CCMP2506" /LENGTH=492 /DNA_ID=CAMNT_0048218521 /DNA_START=79 /DNA_END=1554 /DNA_ORIENTATION=-
MGKSRKVTYELRTASARNTPHIQSCAQEKEEFLTWAVGCLSVFCAITPNVNLLEIAKLWAHPSRAPIVHQNCSTGKASGKSANALLRSIFNEIRYALDKGQDNLARALILSEACFTAFFLNSSNDVVKFLESFKSWPDLDEDDLSKLRSSTVLKNVFAGTNTCTSLSQNVEAVKNKVGMVRYLLLPPWLLQSNTERLHRSLEIAEINFIEKGIGTKHIVRLRCGHTFKTLVILLANEVKTDSPFIRISHDERPLFSSACANRKIEDLGICDGCTMMYFNAQHLRAAAQDAKPDSANSSSRKKSKTKKVGRGSKIQKKRNSNIQPSYISSTGENAKERHSKLLTTLFEEAEPVFKEIRKTLNDLANIQKSNNHSKKRTMSMNKVQPKTTNPSNVGIGNSPGQIMFPIVVGNVDDLYKSSKRSSGRRHSQSKNGTRRLSIDLHGCTTGEALEKLNESLPRWIDSAMRGSHPFVEVVDIITGSGKQILSEAVEGW